MVKQIETENGNCWAIVFNEHFDLGDVCSMQNGLIEIMITATQSALYSTSQEEFYKILRLLDECLLTQDQYYEYERFLKNRK
ncbi:MAG: hypothetical protein FWF54_05330 [Candidatus Azobacteroides sp.]|nr:hypothetical protein [Candidatus Azobacteroides sp.]